MTENREQAGPGPGVKLDVGRMLTRAFDEFIEEVVERIATRVHEKIENTMQEYGRPVSNQDEKNKIEASHPIYDINVNGIIRSVIGPTMTYERLKADVFPFAVPDEAVSITYNHADESPRMGEVCPGGVVKIRNGTVFVAARTDKA